MPQNEPRVGVALTKCFFCLKDDQIVINSLLTNSMAQRVEEMHGKVVNMEPCLECEELMAKQT